MYRAVQSHVKQRDDAVISLNVRLLARLAKALGTEKVRLRVKDLGKKPAFVVEPAAGATEGVIALLMGLAEPEG